MLPLPPLGDKINVARVDMTVFDLAHDQALPHVVLTVVIPSISCIMSATPSRLRPPIWSRLMFMLILSSFELCSSTSITVVARIPNCSSSCPRRWLPFPPPALSLPLGRGDCAREPIQAYTGFRRVLKLGRHAQMMPTYSSRPDQVPTSRKSAMHRD